MHKLHFLCSPHEHKPIRIKNVIYNRSKRIWSKNNPDYFTTKKRFVPTLWILGDTPGSWCWLSREGRAVTACGSVPPLPARPRRWGLHSGTGPTLQLRRRPRHPIKSIYSTVESYNKIPPQNGHLPSFKADVGSPWEVIITPGKVVTTLNSSTYLLTNNRTDLSQLGQLRLTSDVEAI